MPVEPKGAARATLPRRERGPIAVAIVVDQLAAWVLRDRIDRLPSDGGFARLRREGKYFKEMAFAHATTLTAPGHASLFTGKLPREHGIVANDELGPDGKTINALAGNGEQDKIVTLDGHAVEGQGSSLDKLEAPSSLVASVFRSRYPKGQGIVAALSLKDRGALFAAGQSADYTVWFESTLMGEGGGRKERGGFVTSKRYESTLSRSNLAGWLGRYLQTDAEDRRDGVHRIEDQTWVGLDPTWLRENAGAADGGDYAGFVAAHNASQAAKPGAAFRALPASDRLLLEMAIKILKTEPKELPVFLGLSLSANDMIGHLFGPDSWEAWDGLRRLDGALAWFWKELDALAPGGWSVVLSSDHGVPPMEDTLKHPRCDRKLKVALDTGKPCAGESANGARIMPEDFLRAAEVAAGKAGLRDAAGSSIDKIVVGLEPPYLYLTDAAKKAIAHDASARRRLASRFDSGLRAKFKSLQGVFDVALFREAAACPDERKEQIAALVCNSISPTPDRGGDFYVVLKPGAFFDPELVKGMGTSHGSPYGYDRFVPLLVRDPGRPELAGQVEEQRVPFTQFRSELVRIILGAPSLAR